MDIYCQRCSEPWDVMELHSFEEDDYMGARRDFLNGKGCPSCNWGDLAIKDRTKRAEMTQVLREVLGDDVDGIAAELEDMEYMGLLEEDLEQNGCSF